MTKRVLRNVETFVVKMVPFSRLSIKNSNLKNLQLKFVRILG